MKEANKLFKENIVKFAKALSAKAGGKDYVLPSKTVIIAFINYEIYIIIVNEKDKRLLEV